MHHHRWPVLLCSSGALLASCATPAPTPSEPVAEPEPTAPAAPVSEASAPEPRASGWVAPFPHLRVNTTERTVEFDAYVSPLIHSGLDGKNYYLEQFVCVPNTKEHESLLVTEARPSNLHASLLLLGLEPGSPVVWDANGSPVDATGPALRVRFRYEDSEGRTVEIHPTAWTRQAETGDAMAQRDWVFSGSTIRTARGNEFYEADAAGTVIGLASFGGETVSWPAYISDLEDTGDLEWLARTGAMPPARTPVIVVITAVE